MAKKIREEDALAYHSQGRPGKIEVIPTTATETQRDLALAYSPGVAKPCLRIADNQEDVYQYTAKGNLVAVISNGTAVLGLGDIGPEASKPVMEGKGILFKIFADIDVFDLELDTTNIDEFIRTVKILEPTFGGINLEDIKAPDCFEIERRLKEELEIPIMHDDQHGTAIISSAGLLNALEIVRKDIDKVRVVVSGAGASAVSCTRLFIQLGANPDNIIMCDSKGVIRKDRENLTSQKAEFATEVDVYTLEEAIEGADVFLGLSKGDIMTPDMLRSMATRPVVFALANPDPEIDYNVAIQTRKDVVVATGRSDFPNQVNNVLGFPFIFRGALDVRSKAINEEMKLAAVHALAQLAKEPVPEIVKTAYNQKKIIFGKDYIIPKPLDPRLLTTVAPAVAKAAMESGVARKNIQDWEEYKLDLRRRMGFDERLIRIMTNKARQDPQRLVFAEAEDYRVLKAAQIVFEDGVANPILLGRKKEIYKIAEENQIELEGMEIIDPKSDECADKREEYAKKFFNRVQRKGYNYFEAKSRMAVRYYYGAMMVQTGDADALITGQKQKYTDTFRTVMDIIGPYKPGIKIAGMYLVFTKQGPLFMADTTVIPDPSEDDLVNIAVLAAKAVQQFNLQPRIAMLSYSNFGSSKGAETRKVRNAVRKLKEQYPRLIVDGEIQANLALNTDALEEAYPFSPLIDGKPNLFIFPNLAAGNIAYKLLQTVGNAEAVGPMSLGLSKAVHVLQLGSSIREITNMATIAVVDAQEKKKKSKDYLRVV